MADGTDQRRGERAGTRERSAGGDGGSGPTDAALVGGLRAGHETAFDAVYDRYRARVYAFLVRLSGDRAMAEDLAQECWIRLARHANKLEPDTRLGPWLFAVARNLFLSHRRWALLDLERLAEVRLWRAVRGEPASPFELLAASETEQRLEAALARMPLDYREVLLLVGVEHMSSADAGAVVGLAPDALRQRLARARAMLAKALAKDERGSERSGSGHGARRDWEEPTFGTDR